MSNTYQIYLISDSTGETLDRIFLALKAQFKNIEYKVHPHSFTRTQNQIIKILETAKKNENSIILYTIVDNGLAKFLANQSEDKGLPCFGVLGNLILSFSKLLNQRASHQPSGQHVLNEEYYQRIEAIQFTMSHDDGNLVNEVGKSDIILLGVSRTSKTPTSIYLANKGYKTSNIPLVNENSIPKILKENPKLSCVVGLNTEPQRLVDIRKNRMSSLKETDNTKYTNIDNIQKEIEEAKKTFKKYGWPTIDVTRKSVEETAASIIKIYEIYSQNNA
jgi:regulator of PEP synthase PpsR (kinase-PPPase family)